MLIKSLLFSSCLFPQVVIEHSYCMPPEKENIEVPSQVSEQTLAHDHIYTNKDEEKVKEKSVKVEKPPRQRKQKHNYRKLQELQNTIDFDDRYAVQKPMVHDTKFKERDMVAEMGILYEFLTKGIDQEDISYLKQSYEAMLADDTIGYWLNDTHWVDHCVTDLYSSPPKRRKRDDVRVHTTGCARTEGYYKVEAHEKAKYKYHHTKSNIAGLETVPVSKTQGKSI